MKPRCPIFLHLLVFLVNLSLSRIHAQVLVHTDIRILDHIDLTQVQGVFVSGKDLFCLANDQTALDGTGYAYEILDPDPETGTYFWIRPERFTGGKLQETYGVRDVKTLWRGEDQILVRASSNPQTWDLSPGLRAIRLPFQKAVKPLTSGPGMRTDFQAESSLDEIKPILDAVILDSLLLTVKQLSGEGLYMNNGSPDSIMTRYSYSTTFFKAQDYLISRFTRYGYSVIQHSYFLSTFSGLHFAGGGSPVGWLIAEGKIYGTSNDGVSWSLQFEDPEITDLSRIASWDDRTAITIGEGGAIVRTQNSGTRWETLVSPTSEYLFDVFVLNNGLAWICGDHGTLFRTTDYGETWEKATLASSAPRLRSLSFLSPDIGYAAGDSGLILRTVDGGESWNPLALGTMKTITSIHFVDVKTGWIVLSSGDVLTTPDSGETWESVSFPRKVFFKSIRFFDDQRGVILGMDNTALWTQDGGITWESMDPLPGDDLIDAEMSGSKLWILGQKNAAFLSEDRSEWERPGFNGTALRMYNLIAEKTGTIHPNQYWIICAHYDDKSEIPNNRAPGADDNASGSAAVIEAARFFALCETEYSIRFILFSGEEQGGLGSKAYARDAYNAGDSIQGVITLDMTAWDEDGDRLCQIHCGNMRSSYIMGDIMKTAADDFELNLSVNLITKNSTDWSDHASFWDVGYPAVLLIENMSSDLNPYYHSTADTTGWFDQSYFLDNTKMALAGLAMMAVLKYDPHRKIVIDTDPSGFPVIADGTFCPTPAVFVWTQGEQHDIAADSLTVPEDSVRYSYDRWSDGGARTHTITVGQADQTLTAYYDTQFFLTTSVTPPQGGTVSPPPPGSWFFQGEDAVVEAFPATDYVFFGWGRDITGPENPKTILMEKPLTATAVFGNYPPVVSGPDTVFFEDDTLELSFAEILDWIADPNHPDSSLDVHLLGNWTLEAIPDSSRGIWLLFTGIPDWNGQENVIVTAVDPLGASGSDTMRVEVLGVPDPPGPFSLLEPADQSVFGQWPLTIAFAWEPPQDPDPGELNRYVFELDTTALFNGGSKMRVDTLSSEEVVMPWPRTFGDRTYFWRVFVRDPALGEFLCGDSVFSFSLATLVIGQTNGLVPSDWVLSQNYPNPFNSETMLRFGAPRSTNTTISVFNTRGQLIRILVKGEVSAGFHTVTWDGKDEQGRVVPAGVYLVVLRGPEAVRKNKVLHVP